MMQGDDEVTITDKDPVLLPRSGACLHGGAAGASLVEDDPENGLLGVEGALDELVLKRTLSHPPSAPAIPPMNEGMDVA